MKTVPAFKDSYLINGGVFYLLGIMVVIPYQFYMNSLDFWMYKFTPPPPPRPRPGPRPTPSSLHVTPSTLNVHMYPLVANSILSMDDNIMSHEPNFTEATIIKFEVPPSRLPFSIRKQPPLIHSPYPMTSFKKQCNKFNTTSPDQRTPFQRNLITAFSVNFKVMMLGSLLCCSLWSKRLPPPEKRLTYCLIALCVLLFISTVLSQIDIKQVLSLYFAVAMVSATLMNCFTGVAMASLYELITKFPSNYYASIQSGHNISGIISSGLQVIFLSIGLRPDITGTIYFSCGTVILISTTIYYYFTVKDSKYFIYKIGQSEQRKQSERSERVNMINMVEKIKWYYATLIFVEGTTYIVYPGLVALVVSTKGQSLWEEVFFVPVVTFLGYQVSCLIGRETARIIKTPKHGIILFVVAALRICFVPLLIFCNAQPRKHLPVYFGDNMYICIMFLFAFIGGLLVNTSIVAIPSILENEEKEAAMVLVPLILAVTLTVSSALNGTVAFVHRSCLETWLGESNTTTCELCHQVFNTERAPRYTSGKSVWYWCWRSNGSGQDVRSDVIACTIITPLTIIITYICLFSSEYYNQIKFASVPAARWTSVSLLIMIAILLIGYYMWVYSSIRMHARRWYSWWQRTCNVRYIPPGTVRVINLNPSAEAVDECSSTLATAVVNITTSIDERNPYSSSVVNIVDLDGINETSV